MATVFTGTFNNVRSDSNASFRVVCPLTGGALSQVRVTFAGTGTGMNATNASIGISTGSTGDTTAIPVELLFGGLSGFSSAVNITSDWVNLSGFTSSDKLVVIIDFSGSYLLDDVTASGTSMYYAFSAPSYNQATPSGFGGPLAWDPGVALIETQSTTPPPGLPLMGQIWLA